MDFHNALGVAPTSFETVQRERLPYFPHERSHTKSLQDTKLSLRPLQSPVRNQGEANTCYSFGVAGCSEFVIRNGLHGHFPVWDIHLSEAHIIHATQIRHGGCAADGAELWQALETVSVYGVVTADVWPYREDVTCDPHPPDRSRALWYRVRDWKLFHLVEYDSVHSSMLDYANGIGLMRPSYAASILRDRLLAKRAPVLIDIPVTIGNGWDDPTDGNIVMPSPSQLGDWLRATDAGVGDPPGTRGWHAICVTGFDDAVQRFEFKNSWNGWGAGGYGTLPYDYVSAFNRQLWDCFDGFYDSQVGPFPDAI